MTINGLRSSVVVRLLFCCGIALVSALLVRSFGGWNPFRTDQLGPLTAQLITENGFKFESIVNDPKLWLGPQVGFPIDTSKLQDQQEQSLTGVVESENLTMLIAVDRECQVCSHSIEYLNEVRQQLAERNIKYCIISFKPDSSDEYFRFARTLNMDAPSFLWAQRDAVVPSPLSLMALPTHLLVDSQHRIRGIWPGGAEGKTVRGKMAHQIISDIDMLLSEKKSS